MTTDAPDLQCRLCASLLHYHHWAYLHSLQPDTRWVIIRTIGIQGKHQRWRLQRGLGLRYQPLCPCVPFLAAAHSGCSEAGLQEGTPPCPWRPGARAAGLFPSQSSICAAASSAKPRSGPAWSPPPLAHPPPPRAHFPGHVCMSAGHFVDCKRNQRRGHPGTERKPLRTNNAAHHLPSSVQPSPKHSCRPAQTVRCSAIIDTGGANSKSATDSSSRADPCHRHALCFILPWGILFTYAYICLFIRIFASTLSCTDPARACEMKICLPDIRHSHSKIDLGPDHTEA